MLNITSRLIPHHAHLLTPGDIVRFRFPVKEDGDGDVPRPKKRPCLVMQVATLAGHRFVKIAYGTSANSRANWGQEIIVSRPAGLKAAGLSRRTRFVGARSIIVSAAHPGFEPALEDGGMISGRIDEALIARMRGILARQGAV